MSSSTPARVRFAPSPTGSFHIGGARTALYDYLFARQTGGQFILRVEDTDRKRFVEGAEEEMMESLHWLGLDWDEGPDVGGPFGPYRQSERSQVYRDHAERLIESGHAYPCFCSPERLDQVRKLQQQRKKPPRYDGLCRKLDPQEAAQRIENGEAYVIRFKTPQQGRTVAKDLLRGAIEVENASLDDYVLLKSDGLPVYHLAAMVDDHLMQITHVLRSSEWLPTFPLHVLIYQAFEWEQPEWVHLSVFLNPSGKGKMSKREEGVQGIYVQEMREMGYLPEALLNWMALMGWSYDDHTEFFKLPELVDKFSLEKLNPSPAAVNYSKLDHFNGLHIRRLSQQDLTVRLQPIFEAEFGPLEEDRLRQITPLIQERIRTLEDALEIAGFFFQENVEPDPDELVGKNMTPMQSAEAARCAHEVIQAQSPFETEPLEQALRDLAGRMDLKVGQLFGILRVAVTGQRVSPPLIESMIVIGKEAVLQRVEHARSVLSTM